MYCCVSEKEVDKERRDMERNKKESEKRENWLNSKLGPSEEDSIIIVINVDVYSSPAGGGV